MVSKTASSVVLTALLASVAVLVLLIAVPTSRAEGAEAQPPAEATPATGAVTQLGADPTVFVANHRHCVRGSVSFRPRYAGGGGLIATTLFVNGNRAAQRRSLGTIRVSTSRLARGANSYELISEFADGRVASVVGGVRRCAAG